MSTAGEALEATLEARYRAAVEETLSLRAEDETFRGKLARAEANLGDEVADAMEREGDLRADLKTAADVAAVLSQERDGLVEAVRLHLEEHTETARERDEARMELTAVKQALSGIEDERVRMRSSSSPGPTRLSSPAPTMGGW